MNLLNNSALKFLLIGISFLGVLDLSSQTTVKYDLRFSGNISERETNDSLKDVSLKIYNSKNLLVKKVWTDVHGNYRFSLSTLTSDVYIIQITKKGFVGKSFQVSTENMPARHRGTRFPVIEADLGLFKPVKGVNYSALKSPMNRYLYDSIKDNYYYDKVHLDKMLRVQEKLIQKGTSVPAEPKK